MTTFVAFAAFYDIFYRDKDYAHEARFVSSLLREFAPAPERLLDLGCGTGRHAFEFARMGYSVLGIDRSAAMLAVAEGERELLAPAARARVNFGQGDMTAYCAEPAVDAVVCLFHAINYNTTDESLRSALRTARRSLLEGSLFVFDFWHGEGVLADPPTGRVQHAQSHGRSLVRRAEPLCDTARHVVTVNYTLQVTEEATGESTTFAEVHEVRYLFLPEIARLASDTGFEIVASGEWPSSNPITPRSWKAWTALRAV